MPGMLVEDASENGERVGSREQPQQANNKSNMKAVSFQEELWASTDLLFQTKVTWLLVLGPIAVVGGLTESLGPATLFAFSGMALIPCAERLSFITEQVAEHTNGTIGALLNATFGNAPELLISISALRSGYYRVVQLAMLGSMLTNMLLVFGVACVIGGMRWQVQELRITSGNVSMVMLLVATAGSLFPAALVLSGQLSTKDVSVDVPTQEEITFCRLNAFVMLFLYLCYLVFQLGTHKEEFDDEALEGPAFRRARRNLFCLRLMGQAHTAVTGEDNGDFVGQELPLLKARTSDRHIRNTSSDDESLGSSTDGFDNHGGGVDSPDDDDHWIAQEEARQKMRRKPAKAIDRAPPSPRRANRNKSKNSDGREDDDGYESGHPIHQSAAPLISMRVGIFWLFIITLCISAMSDILVDTIDGFARKMHISEVFTSMVIMPIFSNVAELVSAFIFAYRNEMDLCVGVTVGSAIQIATFVMPGSVLIGMFMDRSMTLFFRGYETVCLLFATVIVAAVLQGGTTNWAVGIMLVGIYIMLAAGIWFHELEDLTIDAELLIRNVTSTR